LSKHDFLKMKKIGNIKTLPNFRQIKNIILTKYFTEETGESAWIRSRS